MAQLGLEAMRPAAKTVLLLGLGWEVNNDEIVRMPHQYDFKHYGYEAQKSWWAWR